MEEELLAADMEAVEKNGPNSQPSLQSIKARLDRISDYQASALAKEDPLQANLGSINSGLMGIAVQMDVVIQRMWSGKTESIERIQKTLPALDAYLRVARQIDRYAQIELKASAPRKAETGSTPAKPR